MLHLSLDAINLIDVIARTGSFSAAAEVLHKVPSTISYTISKLEEQMGLTFFERNGPKVRLTPLGQSLLEEGRSLLFAASDLELRLQRLSKGVEPELNIVLAASLSIASYAKDLVDFEQTSLGTQIYIRHEVHTNGWDALLQHTADLVVAPGEGPSSNAFKTKSIGVMEFDFCVAPGHPLTELPQPISNQILLEYPAISMFESDRRSPLRTVGIRYGQKQIVVDSLSDKIRLQKLGVGHGFLPRAYVEKAVKSGDLVVLEIEEPKRPIPFSLGWRNGEDGPVLNWWRERLARPLDELLLDES